METPYIITVTGTKGKTTVTRLLNYIFCNHTKKFNVLYVDTDGHYFNNKRKGTLKDSKKLYGLVPTVCPGRFLYRLENKENPIAILEASVGSSALPGMGYCLHNIGIFTNVYDDHVGYRMKTRKQLAHQKARFVFRRTVPKGISIFNADDKYVCGELSMVRVELGMTLLPVGLNAKHFEIKKHIKEGGSYITMQDSWIGIETQKGFRKLLDVKKIPWTFQGEFKPSIYNIMFALAGVYAQNKFKVPQRALLDLFYSYTLDKEGGRLTQIENKKKGYSYLVDFAHEKYSLTEVGNLAKKLSTNKTIGVVRLGADRKDDVLVKTGEYIANKYDVLIVFDKIDGVKRKSSNGRGGYFPTREVGEISKLFFKGIKNKKRNKKDVHYILQEKDAIKLASQLAEKGDVIVTIPGHSHTETIKEIKKHIK